MSTINIGGIIGILHNNTLSKGFDKTHNGDTVKLGGLTLRTLDGIVLTNDLYIEGAKKLMVVTDKYHTGFLATSNKNISFSNISFDVAPQSNAIATSDNYTGAIELHYITTTARKTKYLREYYPTVAIFNASNIIIDNCDLDSIAIDSPHAHIEITNSNIGNLTTASSTIKAHSITIHNSRLANVSISSTDTQIYDSVTNGNVKISDKAKINNLATEFTNLSRIPRALLDSNIIALKFMPGSTIIAEKLNILAKPNFKNAQQNKIPYYGLSITEANVTLKNSVVQTVDQPNIINNSEMTIFDSDIAENWIQTGTVDINTQKSPSTEDDRYDALAKLHNMIGLAQAKEQITKLIKTASVNKLRAEKGLPIPEGFSKHMVFQGNAGTGKTTVARIYGQALFERGVLKTNKFKEANANDLIAEYVGQTGPKTQKVIDDALDGVLFIDEAYALIPSENNSFAREAVTTLLAGIENNRDRLVVILAGYKEDLDQLLASNQGLASRIPNRVTFEDYTIDELNEIAYIMFKNNQFIVNKISLSTIIEKVYNQLIAHTADIGNGRFARNMVQSIITAQNSRLAEDEDVSTTALQTITDQDIIDGANQLLTNYL